LRRKLSYALADIKFSWKLLSLALFCSGFLTTLTFSVMSKNIIAKAQTTIQASAAKVWGALTTPALIKQYFFGTDAVSDWKIGSSLQFKGVWEGKEYIDKGTILRSVPEKLFQYTYFSSFSGLKDSPENYANISYELDGDDDQTTLIIKQENIADEKAREQSEKNWAMVLDNLKKMLER
jgi:uncharacterized protein YndB with AHSA1/START domain